jgi:Bacterial extracellular solute-binding protein/SIR2-like domain/von Willebrand factor type A domain
MRDLDPDPLRDDLLDDLVEGRVLVVVGSGVSLATTADKDVAGWPGLLRSGLKHLVKIREVTPEWAASRFKESDKGDGAELVEVAQDITSKLPAGEYRRWFEEQVGELAVVDDSVIVAIARLKAPIATTNYDNLIEDVTHLRTVTWKDPYLFLQKQRETVLHLHGHRDSPDSIVLGTVDYAGITSDEAAQEVQRALWLTKTMLLVGFGAGLDDPNLEALRTWMRKVWGEAGFRHYRLCLKRELEALDEQHHGEQIYPLAYGTSHKQLADYLNTLADEAERRRRERSWFEGVPSRMRTKVGAAAAWLVRAQGRLRAMPRLALLGLAVVVAGLMGLAAWAVWLQPEPCPIPQELVVLTTPTKEASVRQLAVAFGDREPGSCRRSNLAVFSVPSSSEVAGAVAAGWPVDDLRLGPQPAVWLPDATAEVERVNQRLDKDLEPLGSIATSPVVLAVPQSAMAKVGQARTVPWETMVEWAKSAAPGSRLRIGRPDPTSSTAGLLATIGLHSGSGRPATPNSRHAVEQAVDPVADELTELCQLGQPGGPAQAVIVSEQAMVSYNRDARLGGACDARSRRTERLTAVYAVDGTPVLDHPFVLLPPAAELGDRARLARDFFAYLTGPDAQDDLREAGFRDVARNVGGSLGANDGVLVHDPPAWARPPGGITLARELAAWQKARLPARALLAMDVSGSMNEQLPGPGGRRITAARQAAARAVGLMGDKDQVGLWKFSQSLDGPRDYQELVPLGPAGPRAGGGRGSERVVETLDGLAATDEDTGLYDTMHAGIAELREGGSADAVDALVVVTDGQNEDTNGGVSLGEVVGRLRDGEEVLVFLLTFGPARCDTGELGQLSGQRELVRCIDADRIGLERAFEQVAATLWGTGRLAGRTSG